MTEGPKQVSVAELLARNGQQVGSSTGGRRRRGGKGGVSVASLTGDIPVVDGPGGGRADDERRPEPAAVEPEPPAARLDPPAPPPPEPERRVESAYLAGLPKLPTRSRPQDRPPELRTRAQRRAAEARLLAEAEAEAEAEVAARREEPLSAGSDAYYDALLGFSSIYSDPPPSLNSPQAANGAEPSIDSAGSNGSTRSGTQSVFDMHSLLDRKPVQPPDPEPADSGGPASEPDAANTQFMGFSIGNYGLEEDASRFRLEEEPSRYRLDDDPTEIRNPESFDLDLDLGKDEPGPALDATSAWPAPPIGVGGARSMKIDDDLPPASKSKKPAKGKSGGKAAAAVNGAAAIDAGQAIDVGPDIAASINSAPAESGPAARSRAAAEMDFPTSAWSLSSQEPQLLSGPTLAGDLMRGRPQQYENSDQRGNPEPDEDPTDVNFPVPDEQGDRVKAFFDDVDDEDDQAAIKRQWWILGGQSLGAAVTGVLLFKGFEQLWEMLPPVALALAVTVILGLVALVRVLRRTDDLLSIVIAIVVGVFVTVGPLAFLLSTG